MKLIVGLGNPGKEYENTRHNVGFYFLDECSKKFDFSFSKEKFGGIYGEKNINGEKIMFLKPQKYMNLSGDVIIKYVNFFKIKLQDILIICDDMHTDVGKIRLRYKGSSAGHNGLKNIENNLKTQDYKRIKIGISSNGNADMKNYVLGKFSKQDILKINEIISFAPQLIEDYTKMSFDNLMNKYN